MALLAANGVDCIPAARAQSLQARSHISAEIMRMQILNVSAQITIRIETTAASSMAVIPLKRDIRECLPCRRFEVCLSFTENLLVGRGFAYITTLRCKREVYVKNIGKLGGKTFARFNSRE